MRILTYKGKRVRLTDRMYAMLEEAGRHPKGAWFSIGWEDEDAEAAKRLVKAGLIEVRPAANQYRLTP